MKKTRWSGEELRFCVHCGRALIEIEARERFFDKTTGEQRTFRRLRCRRRSHTTYRQVDAVNDVWTWER